MSLTLHDTPTKDREGYNWYRVDCCRTLYSVCEHLKVNFHHQQNLERQLAEAQQQRDAALKRWCPGCDDELDDDEGPLCDMCETIHASRLKEAEQQRDDYDARLHQMRLKMHEQRRRAEQAEAQRDALMLGIEKLAAEYDLSLFWQKHQAADDLRSLLASLPAAQNRGMKPCQIDVDGWCTVHDQHPNQCGRDRAAEPDGLREALMVIRERAQDTIELKVALADIYGTADRALGVADRQHDTLLSGCRHDDGYCAVADSPPEGHRP